MTLTTLQPLGNSDLLLSPIGLGSWQFSGSQGIGSRFWRALSDEEITLIIAASINGGINWIDTAEAYGKGYSETIIAKSLQHLEEESSSFSPPFIADKWWPLGRKAHSLQTSIDKRREALNYRTIDLYQIHHPTSISSIEKQMIAMSSLVSQKKIRYVGVSNFSAKQMRKAHKALKAQGIELVSNQVRYNLVDRSIEHNGILETAKELGIAVIAYSPLHQGLLTGKFHADPSLLSSLFPLRKLQYQLTQKNLTRTQPLIDGLIEVGNNYSKTPSQVALNWLIHVNGSMTFAIPGASKLHHVQENVDAMTFRLTQDELNYLTNLSNEV